MPFRPLVFRHRDNQWNNMGDMPLPGPGGEMHVVVGEPGRQSAVWRISAPPDKFDVYIEMQCLAQYMKWSLHESGIYRYAWIKSEKAKEKAAEFGHTGDRLIRRSPQPDEIRGYGLNRGLEVRVRQQDLVGVAEPESVPADAYWIPAPPVGYAVCWDVFVARAKQSRVIDIPGFRPFAGMSLVEDRAVLLYHELQPIDDQHNEIIGPLRAHAIDAALQASNDLGAAGVDLTKEGLRIVVGGTNDDDDEIVYDLAVIPNPGA
jgi:hypothetical protein